MHKSFLLIPAFVGAVFTRLPTTPKIKAIIPTSAGQIGVNPVSLVKPDTQYYSIGPATTKWIGVNTIIVETITQISKSVTVVVTTSAVVAIKTATAAADGLEVGDLNFVITPAAKEMLQSLFKGVEVACGGHKKRQEGIAACAMKYIEENAPAELSKKLMDAGLRFLDGAGNLIEYIWDGSKIVVGAEELAVVGGSLTLAFLGLTYASWKATKKLPDGVRIPKTKIKTKTASSTTTSVPRRGTIVPSHFMTDYFNSPESAFNKASAGAMATVLQNVFGSLTGTPCVKRTLNNCIYNYEDIFVPKGKPCPTIPVLPASCTPCVKRTIVNCIYNYEDIAPNGKPCPPIPVLPASCAAQPTQASRTDPLAPKPTAQILIIWKVPPVTGPVTYNFYDKRLDFTGSLDSQCGSIVDSSIAPALTANDPKMGRVDGNRPKAGLDRLAPGTIGPLDFAGREKCSYKEDKIGSGEITCNGGFKAPCNPPMAELAGKIAPNNGACTDKKNVVNLVMICPYK